MFGWDRAERRIIALLQTLHQDMLAGMARLERFVTELPTRQELDAAKTQLRQAITDAAQRVADDIQALRDELAKGNPIEDADLADIQTDITALGQIDAHTPPPTP